MHDLVKIYTSRSLSLVAALAAANTLGCGYMDMADGSTADNTEQALACPDSPAPELFDAAVCICEDFGDVGNLLVGASVLGETPVMAVNGETAFINNARIKGDFIGYGGLEAIANVEVDRHFESADTVKVTGRMSVGGDMEVGNELRGIGYLDVDGTLRVAGTNAFLGVQDVNAAAPYENTPEPPCGCDPATFLDIESLVAEAAAQNDNAAQGLETDLSSIGARSVRLTNGSYYFTDVDNIGLSHIVVDGVVAMYIDGNLDSIGAEHIEITPGSTLDLYVTGSVRNVGHISLGDKYAPSSFRLYIGGAEKCTLSVGNAQFNGAIYAPEAELHYVGNTQIRGAVFAKKILGVGNLTVGYAAPEAPETCEPPTDEPPPEPEDQEDPPIIVN